MNRKSRLTVVLASLLTAGATSQAAVTVTFQQGVSGYASATDTYIDGTATTTGRGSSTTLRIDVSPDKQQALIRFGQLFESEGGPVPDGATITSATLRLVVGTGAGTVQQIGFHRMKGAWSDSATWATFGAAPWNTSGGVQPDNIEAVSTADVSTTIPDGVNVISVTSSILAWQASPSSNFGWVLNETVDDSVTFDSSESATPANRPLLSITYDAPASCIDDGDCNDGNPCTVDSCDNSLCAHTPVSCDWGACNPSSGQCEVTLSFRNGVAGYSGTIDTYLDEANPALSHATDTAFFMDGDPTIKQGLLRFDGIFGSDASSRIPPGSTILSATLTVNVNDPSNTGALFHRMLRCWQDSNTWTTFGSGIQADGVEAVAAADATAIQDATGSLVITVTSSVAAWSAGQPNLGWALLPGGGAGFAFDSSEGSIKPLLTVTFSPPATCTVDADCDDGNGCTDDVCNTGTGYCSNTPNIANSCSDGISCTTDSCDACGVCNSVDNCSSPSVCNHSSGQCEAPPSPPSVPANPTPANGATGTSRNPQLCADVSDPNGGVLDVTYYGRPVTTGGGGEVFTIIALPDTQFYSESFPSQATAQMNWIRDNRIARNIVAVTELGDCVNVANQAAQWANADAAHLILENPGLTGLLDGIPYGVAVGNHDQNPQGAARNGADENATTTDYNATFPKSRFASRAYHGGNYPLPGFADSMDNHYELFSASGMDFIVFHLEWDEGNCSWPSDGSVPVPTTTCQSVLAWTRDLLVNTYSNRRAIITTHFMGTPTSGGNGTLPLSNQGQAVINMAKGTPNVFMCLGGHLDQADSRTDTANDGHTIYTFVSDYQSRPNGGNGWLRIMTFDPQADLIHVETYSPSLNRFINKLNDGTPNNHADNLAPSENDFTVAYDMDDGGPFSVIGSASTTSLAPDAPEWVCMNWASLDADQQYEWYAAVEDSGGLVTTGPRWFFTTANTCDTPADCDDGNPCTDDACVDNLCEYSNTIGACADDGNPCTDDICSGGACTHPNNDSNACTDNNDCTTDACVSGECQSTYSPAGGCCNSDADCDDGNPGTTDLCTGAPGGVCSNEVNSTCATDGDCNDSDACTTDACVGGNISALNFDGTNDYVTMGAAAGESALGARAFTLEAWVRRDGASWGTTTSTGTGGVTGVPIITKGRGESESAPLNCNYFLGITAGGTPVADFEQQAAGGGWAVGQNHPICGSITISDQAWHHLAVTYSVADGWRMYVDGVEGTTGDGTSCTTCSPAGSCPRVPGVEPEYNSTQHFGLGSAMTSNGTRDGLYAGMLDEVRVWNIVRTPAEIAGSMNEAITSAAGLIGRWGFEENTGTAAADSTSPAQNGTLTESTVAPVTAANGPAWSAADKAPLDDGLCTFTPIPDCESCTLPTDCDDSNACTTDSCVDGVCQHDAVSCDDGNECTDDSCNPISGCEHVNNTAACDDGDDCTSDDACVAGDCTGTPIIECCDDDGDCDDGNACTVDDCATPNNSALAFDGVDDYVTMGAAPNLNAATFTIECWFYRTGAGVSNQTGGGGIANVVPLVTKGAPEADGSNLDANYILAINTSGNVLAADFEDAATGLNHPISGTTSIAMNTWYHAAATYDGSTWRLYLNGSLEATLAVGAFTPRADSIQHAGIGAMLTSTGNRLGAFAGRIDEVRIWNYARSLSEIQTAMNSEITSTAGLLGRWGLNEGTGAVAADSTTPSENGTLTNGPTWVTTNLPDLGMGGCTHAPIPGCCNVAADCDDNDACTLDSCDGNACVHDPIPGCCHTAADCDDADPCTEDICNGGMCENNPIAECCSDVSDCNDGDTCTLDQCATANSGAITLDGVNDHVNLGAASAITSFGTGSLTIEGWFRADTAATALSGIFRHGRQGAFSQIAVQLAGTAPFNRLTASVESNTAGTQVDTPITAPAASFTLNAWHHFAAVIDRQNVAVQELRLYVDGALAGSVSGNAWGTSAISSTDAVVFGAARLSDGSLGNYFDGSLDEFRIWNHVRTVQQITDNMLVEISSAPGLIARWGMNEGTGVTTADSIGLSTGTLTNGAGWITSGLVDMGNGSCSHTPISGCCVSAAECDDSDDCTADDCVNNACVNDPIPGCCNVDADCDDSSFCTDDACVDNACVNTPIPNCCTADGDCDDGDDCTADLCQLSNAGALTFDGVNDYVTMGTAAGLGAQQFTLECWFNWAGGGDVASSGTGGVTSGIPIIAKGRGEADGNNLDCNYFLAIDSTTSRLAADFESFDPSPNNFPVFGGTVVTTNTWHHVAATYDGTCWTLYLDGAVDGTACPARVPRSDSIQHFAIGAALTSTGVADGAFQGAIDEVRVWDHARTQAEIQSTMSIQIATAPGLLGSYGLNEGAGTLAANSAGAGLNGTLTNGPAWTTANLVDMGDNACVFLPISGCCNTAADCDDGDPCTDDICNNGACENPSIGGCCASASDCNDNDPCTLDSCENNVCVNDPDPDVCDDGIDCTVDACVAMNAAALSFDGVNDHVAFGVASTHPELALTQYTLECWFKRTGPGIEIAVATGGVTATPIAGRGRGVGDGGSPNVDINYLLAIQGGKLFTTFESFEAPGGNNDNFVIGATTITDSVWHHAAVTFDGSNLRVYLDGAEDGVLATTNTPHNDSVLPFSIATAMDQSTPTPVAGGFFQGLIDEVRVWNYARSAGQIADDMNRALDSETGLVGRWSADEGAGTTLADSSSSANGGVLTGGAGWVTTGLTPLTACSHTPTMLDCQIAAPSQVCAGEAAVASVSEVGAGAVYTWSVSGGVVLAGQGTSSIEFSATDAGPVTIDVTADLNGCTCGDSLVVSAVACVSLQIEIPGMVMNPPLVQSATREVTVVLTTCGDPPTQDVRSLSAEFFPSGSSGVATLNLINVDPSVGWISVRTGHSLRKTAPLEVVNGAAAVTVTLIAGDLRTAIAPQDDLIDIVDFAILAGRWGTAVGECGSGDPEDCDYGADVTGDGMQGTADFQAIQLNFFATSDSLDACPGRGDSVPVGDDFANPDEDSLVPIIRKKARVQLKSNELRRVTGIDARAVDLNADGFVDVRDMKEFARRKRLTLEPSFLRKVDLQEKSSKPETTGTEVRP